MVAKQYINNNIKSPLVVITGQTASGKSALAMQIAKKHNGEIICADSRTVYRGMDIGTAKPTKQEQREIPHHVIDIIDPSQTFSAAEFKKLADIAINDIASRGKLPIMVGGTGLYIDAVIFNYQFGAPANKEAREKLALMSVEQLQQMCTDKNIVLPFNKTNKRHLIRAIELGGVNKQTKVLRANTIVTAVSVDKQVLKDRILKRIVQMFEQGIVQEVQDLGLKYGWTNEAMTGDIYRVLGSYAKSKIDIQKIIEQSAKSDLLLAKRQMTWFKRNPYIVWGSAEQLTTAIEHFIHQNELYQSMP